MSNAPARVEPQRVLAQRLNLYKPVVEKLLARTSTSAETFVAQIANACRATPALWSCEPETVLGAALRCAQLNLAPNDGTNLAWIIPYGKSATFQIGYGGVLELARRATPGVLFDGRPVYPGDEFDLDYGREPMLVHRPAIARSRTTRERHAGGDAYAWYVRARYPDGRTHVHVLDRDGVEYHRSFSKQPKGEMWTKSYDAAALKSVVFDMRRWLPTSPSLSIAAEADGAVVDVRDIAAAETPEITHVADDIDDMYVYEQQTTTTEGQT